MKSLAVKFAAVFLAALCLLMAAAAGCEQEIETTEPTVQTEETTAPSTVPPTVPPGIGRRSGWGSTECFQAIWWRSCPSF